MQRQWSNIPCTIWYASFINPGVILAPYSLLLLCLRTIYEDLNVTHRKFFALFRCLGMSLNLLDCVFFSLSLSRSTKENQIKLNKLKKKTKQISVLIFFPVIFAIFPLTIIKRWSEFNLNVALSLSFSPARFSLMFSSPSSPYTLIPPCAATKHTLPVCEHVYVVILDLNSDCEPCV